MKKWHDLSHKQVIKELESNAANGLSASETEKRLKTYGLNKLDDKRAVRWYRVLLRQFTGILILLLIVAAALSLSIGEVMDALAILAIIILNGLLGFSQEWKAESTLKGLKKIIKHRCLVIRNGKVTDIDAEYLVPGDCVLLENGNIVPADIRLTDSVNLKTDESALTGESLPVAKSTKAVKSDAHISGQTCIAWMGTNIVNGRGQGIVVATGRATEFGKIANLTGQIKDRTTRLQLQLTVLGKQLAIIALSVAAITVIAGWLWGKPLAQMFMAGVSLAVAAVPEGLPAVVTITFALGIGIMARKKALLRHLQAAETLGATTIICTDKTGTLTKNEMTIQEVWLANGNISISGEGYNPEGTFSRDGEAIDPNINLDLMALLDTGVKCNHAQIAHEELRWVAMGSPTEASFIVAAAKAGLHEIDRSHIYCEFSFNSSRKRMSVVEQCHDNAVVHVKGAPEVLLSRSSKILINGVEEKLDEEAREEIKQAYQSLAQKGLRTLALARKTLEKTDIPDELEAENDLIFLGLVGIIDPPRAEVYGAIDKARKAGIQVVMITGDSPDTALAVAKKIGLTTSGTETCADLSNVNDHKILEIIEHGGLFARAIPEDKYRIVKLLQEQGHVVAMTGDGINDAPSLKQADIGIAMGIRGTDVAKGAADIVLLDDNFSSIVSAIEEGRRQYENIRKFVHYLVSSNIGEALAILINIVTGAPLILLPIQILWVNLVTDSITALSLSFEKAEGDLMKELPRSVSQPILDRYTILRLGFFGGYISLVSLLLFDHYLDTDYALANTIAFTGLVVMANIHTLNFRSFNYPLFRVGWFSNPWLLGAILCMLVLQVCAIYLTPFQHALNTVPLGLHDWGVIIIAALPLFIITEFYKIIKSRGVDS